MYRGLTALKRTLIEQSFYVPIWQWHLSLTFFSFLDFLVPVDFEDFIEDVLEAEGDNLIDEALDSAGEAILYFIFSKSKNIKRFNFYNILIHPTWLKLTNWYLFADIYWFY